MQRPQTTLIAAVGAAMIAGVIGFAVPGWFLGGPKNGTWAASHIARMEP